MTLNHHESLRSSVDVKRHVPNKNPNSPNLLFFLVFPTIHHYLSFHVNGRASATTKIYMALILILFEFYLFPDIPDYVCLCSFSSKRFCSRIYSVGVRIMASNRMFWWKFFVFSLRFCLLTICVKHYNRMYNRMSKISEICFMGHLYNSIHVISVILFYLYTLSLCK